jgi:hypothetical protein
MVSQTMHYSERIRKPKTFRIIFKTKDGSLIMDKTMDPDFINFNEDFVRYFSATDARQRGVRIVSIKLIPPEAHVLVEYLK